MATMKIKEIMTTRPDTVRSDTPVREAAKKLADGNVGMLPVLSDDNRPVGTLTDRDIVVRGIARGVDVSNASVDKVMARDVVACDQDTPVEEATELMRSKQIRRLLVTEHDALVGVVSLADLATKSEDRELVATTLERISR